MDLVHAEFDSLVAQAVSCPDDELQACLHRLQAHLLAHFSQEDEWMRSTDFPSADCHIEEHGKVLASSRDVATLVDAGNLQLGRAFVAELARWFPGHADYLDSALAAWMCKRQFGGTPVVLHPRRRV
jgi:hemerythrin